MSKLRAVIRNGTGNKVYLDGIALHPTRSLRLVNHSPDGFAWGYGGSGPSQLALALLLHLTDSEEYALSHYQNFKWDIVAKWPNESFEIETDDIDNWIRNNP